MTGRRAWLTALLLVVAAGTTVACRTAPTEPAPEARFGVLFGGQVQQREQIPLELDRTRQTTGFHVKLSAPLRQPARLSWEVTRLQRTGPGRAPERVTELGDATLAAGTERFEQALPFTPNDAPGAWRIRILLDGATLLDRPFEVVRP